MAIYVISVLLGLMQQKNLRVKGNLSVQKT